MKRGDVLLKINGEAISGVRTAMDKIVESRPGTKLTISVIRDGKPLEVEVTIEGSALPEPGQRERRHRQLISRQYSLTGR